jgi:short chain dehydrogenase
MGEVFRARDTKLGRDVAIKVLPEAFAQDGERLARFEREAKLLRADFANGQAFNVHSSQHIVSFGSERLKEDAMSGTNGTVVAITGASSGIGEAVALLLAERGAQVVLGARGPDRLAALADRIARTGGPGKASRSGTSTRSSTSTTSYR